MHNDLVTVDPDILGGAPVFAGTRVMVKTLTDYLQAGDTIDTFLADFPSVGRSQVVGLLKDSQQIGQGSSA